MIFQAGDEVEVASHNGCSARCQVMAVNSGENAPTSSTKWMCVRPLAAPGVFSNYATLDRRGGDWFISSRTVEGMENMNGMAVEVCLVRGTTVLVPRRD